MTRAIDSTLYFADKWVLWKSAKEFPKLTQRCNYTLIFSLGQDDFGFSYGNFDRRYTGPKIDLTGATVKLIGEQLPVKPSLVDGARGEPWGTTRTIFSVDGTITDAEEGEVTFALNRVNTDVIGQVIVMVEITDASENIIVPGYVRITFLERLG